MTNYSLTHTHRNLEIFNGKPIQRKFENRILKIGSCERALSKTNSFSGIILKAPVKLIKRVKIAHVFLQSVSDLFHVIISSLPM